MFDSTQLEHLRTSILNYKLENISNKELENLVNDLELIDSNERSNEILKLTEKLINVVQTNFSSDTGTLFRLLNIVYSQLWVLSEQEKIKAVIKEMYSLATREKDELIKAIAMSREALLIRLKGENKEAYQLILKAYSVIKNNNEINRNKLYYDTLYIYISFSYDMMSKDENLMEMLDEIINYYYSNSFYRPLILSISLKLMLCAEYQLDDEAEKLLTKLEKEQLDQYFTNENKVIFYFRIGKYYYITYKIDKAQKYLQNVLSIIEKEKEKDYLLYYEIFSLMFIARDYALEGELDKAIDYLKKSYKAIEDNKEKIHDITSERYKLRFYTTLNFILYHANKDTNIVHEQHFLEVTSYLRDNSIFLNEFLISKDIQKVKTLNEIDVELLDILLGENQKNILNRVKKLNEKIIESKSDLEYKLFNRLELCKLLLPLGKYSEFIKIIEQIHADIDKTEVQFLKLIFDLYYSIYLYIKDRKKNLKVVISKLDKLEETCETKKLLRLKEQVQLYRRLINSRILADKFEKQFRYAAYADIYDEESKKAVFSILNNSKKK